MVKLEDQDNSKVHYTNVTCEFLDTDSCRCSDYSNRAKINPRCTVLRPDNLDALDFMPFTCAYRLLHEGRTLEGEIGDLFVSNRVVSEAYIHDEQLPEHIVDWVTVDKS